MIYAAYLVVFVVDSLEINYDFVLADTERMAAAGSIAAVGQGDMRLRADLNPVLSRIGLGWRWLANLDYYYIF